MDSPKQFTHNLGHFADSPWVKGSLGATKGYSS